MIIKIKVITRAKKERVEKQSDGSFKVWVLVVPEKGKANERVIKLLAKHFDKPKSNFQILTGHKSGTKRVEFF